MTDTEKRIIRNCIVRLQGQRASDEIKAILANTPMRLFLQSWVIGPLEIIASDDRTRDDMKTADALARI